jgi:crotonobetainyl-CoA:carnitine CoA-transferase CaiB-like acyl-CoA transferase
MDRLWTPVCEAIGRPELAGDPRFATRSDRLGRRAELPARLADVFRTHSVAEWMARLAHDVLCAPVNR